MSFSQITAATAHNFGFNPSGVGASGSSAHRWNGFPIRCLFCRGSVPIFYLFKPKLCFHGSRVLCSALSQKGLNDRINTFKQQKSIQQLCMKHNHQNGTFIASGRKIWAHELLIMITKRDQIIDISVLI